MTLLSEESPAAAHGIGLFETMLVRDGRIVQAGEHFQRMAASAAALHFPPPGESAFHNAVAAAVTGRILAEMALRCVYLAVGPDLDRAADWSLTATCAPIPATTLPRRKGARVVTLAGSLARALPAHKMTSYAASVIGLRTAVAAGADEGLFVDGRGAILEGTATNVFALAGSTLITAPLEAGILPGIVRAWVLAHAAVMGLEIIERPPSAEELRNGSFLTSSLTTLAPIVSIDARRCNPPEPAFDALRRMYARSFEISG